MQAAVDYKLWLLRREELMSEAAKIRLAQQARRDGRTTRNPLRRFAASEFLITGDLRRHTS